MRLLRKLPAILAAAAFFAASMLVSTAPAQAAACTTYGPFSYNVSVATTYATIDVYRGAGCGGSRISYGRATLVGSNVRLYAVDIACDNTGLTTRTTGGQSVASTGCGNTASTLVSRSASGNIFWVQVLNYVSPNNSIPI